jgi:hypothetical protein
MSNAQKPLYILAVAPYESSKLKLFEGGTGSISELFMRENGFRYAGWDLSTGNKPKIMEGEYLEAKIDAVKNINLYEDGRFICSVAADYNFLAWPLNNELFYKKPRLNPIAIAEITYNFVNFYKKLIPFFIKIPDKFRFVVQFKNAFLDKNTRIYLVPGSLKSIEWLIDSNQYPAPDDNMDKYEDVDSNVLVEEKAHVAYLLVEKLYLWFGLEKDCIPYVSKDNNGKDIIDVDKIVKEKG